MCIVSPNRSMNTNERRNPEKWDFVLCVADRCNPSHFVVILMIPSKQHDKPRGSRYTGDAEWKKLTSYADHVVDMVFCTELTRKWKVWKAEHNQDSMKKISHILVGYANLPNPEWTAIQCSHCSTSVCSVWISCRCNQVSIAPVHSSQCLRWAGELCAGEWTKWRCWSTGFVWSTWSSLIVRFMRKICIGNHNYGIQSLAYKSVIGGSWFWVLMPWMSGVFRVWVCLRL